MEKKQIMEVRILEALIILIRHAMKSWTGVDMIT